MSFTDYQELLINAELLGKETRGHKICAMDQSQGFFLLMGNHKIPCQQHDSFFPPSICGRPSDKATREPEEQDFLIC
jgi:hypothetical protein